MNARILRILTVLQWPSTVFGESGLSVAFARIHTLCPRPGQQIGTRITDLSPEPAACRALAGRLEAFQLAYSNPEEAGRFVRGQKDLAVIFGCPTGAARALLRVLDKAPETALRVLT